MSVLPVSMRQYDASPIIQSILNLWAESFDSDAILNEIYTMCVNIDTCEGEWLDVWGRKVGVSRSLLIENQEIYLGFQTVDNYWENFGGGVWYTQGQTQVYAMSDEAYRLMIMAKAFANITDGTPQNLNKLLQIMFAGKRCYVNDLGHMMMRYTFEFALEPWQLVIVLSGILPRPAAVLANVVEFVQEGYWGFSEAQDAYPFNDGTFYNGVTYNVN